MTLDEIIDSPDPWPKKRRALIDFPYKADRPRAEQPESFVDWALQPPDSLEALASAARTGRLTVDQYREVVDARTNRV